MKETPTNINPGLRSADAQERQSQYSRIPDLVRETFVENPKKGKLGRRARFELLSLIKKDLYFDPVIFAVSEAQKMILLSKETHAIKHWAGLLEEVVDEGIGRPSLKQKA